MSEFYFSKLDVDVDRTLEPSWSKKVPRWYQLDDAAFAIAEWGSKLMTLDPELFFLFIRGASNKTDRQFVMKGTFSPQDFVHTLPSVRFGTLAELMGWSVPMICQCEETTPNGRAFLEGQSWARHGASRVLSVAMEPNGVAGFRFMTHAFSFPQKSLDNRFIAVNSNGNNFDLNAWVSGTAQTELMV
ncbi:MAG: hypothetical protein KDD25_03835 [Bdellovibrionales bacterium]|nr:hypothetical protein [Bdellovibrionales bacterium]